jgi:hypothetical protein
MLVGRGAGGPGERFLAAAANRAVLAGLMLAICALLPAFARAQEGDRAALLARYAAFKAGTPFQVRSRDDSHNVMAEIHGVLPFPFAAAAAALKDPSHWCEILLLHLDTKDCRVASGPRGTLLQAGVVTHYDQPASTAYRVAFDYRLGREAPDYVAAHLDADDGPVDTTEFRILFEAVPADDGGTFAHMSYSYSYGSMSDLALRLYLLTFGRNKVGFSVVGMQEDGRPRYIGGMRGVVERNTVRYYFAVQAWLAARELPREARIEQALRNWYALVERWPRQLHELSESRYLAMKRREMGLAPE